MSVTVDSSIGGRGDAAKLDVSTGSPLSGALNSTSMCSVEVDPVRVRMRTFAGSVEGTPGSSDEVGVSGGEDDVTVDDSTGTVGGSEIRTSKSRPGSRGASAAGNLGSPWRLGEAWMSLPSRPGKLTDGRLRSNSHRKFTRV